MKLSGKEAIKEVLGEIPWAAEVYWLLRQRDRPISRFSLKHLNEVLADGTIRDLVLHAKSGQGKRVFIFATLHYWIEHATILGLALAGQGHQVTLGYLPYGEWHKPIKRFDLRRQNIYARRVLSQASPPLQILSLIDNKRSDQALPHDLEAAVEKVSAYDTQYTLQVETVDPQSELYQLRIRRNREAAQAALSYLRANRPDVVIVPNGTIQELGIVYRVARHLRIPTVTYEFGDQQDRIWIAQNAEVMRQETDGLWTATQDQELTDTQMERLRSLFAARQKAAVWENFTRRWQGTPAQGGEQARAALGLDSRPVVLLATNVLGDSLTLGRQVFSQNMADWISRTVQYFVGCPEAQLVVRVHPGEVLTHGQSMVEVVHQVLPRLPEHIHLIGPRDKINTYDLIDVADIGLVYTTTVGMEMAMNGLPVIVSGQTHYRGRGFTLDPDSWVTYFKMLGQALANPKAHLLNHQQLMRAWQYAYRFFFDFPRPFPWHLVHLWEDFHSRTMASIFSTEGEERYRETFRYLVGEPMNWKEMIDTKGENKE